MQTRNPSPGQERHRPSSDGEPAHLPDGLGESAIPGEAESEPVPAVVSKFITFARHQRPYQWVITALILVIALLAIFSVATNKNFQWNVVGQYLFSAPILSGVGRTLELTAVSAAIGFILALVLAMMRLSGAPLAQGAAWLYIWFFRGTPLLVQLIFWFNFGALYHRIGLGIPSGPSLFSVNSNSVVTAFSAAILGLGLNSAAYMSEIVRAGIQSIHHGQSEAAKSLGLSQLQTLRFVLMPQAMRVIVPPVSNEVISMLKYSSIVSVLALPELLYSAQLIYARNFETIPLLMVTCIWYLGFTTVLSIGQYYLEQYYGKGVRKTTRIKAQAAASSGPLGDDGVTLAGGAR